jgi:nicotinamidase-related amidase
MEIDVTATLDQARTAVLLIDYQELLFNAMPESIRDQNLRQATTLLHAARVMDLSVIVTEQYPGGLGPTLGPLRGVYEAMTPYPKLDFSAAEVDEVIQDLEAAQTTDVLIAGMETHICVLQTVMQLQARGLKCHIMTDAVISRRTLDWKRGLELCQAAGADLSTVEIALFRLLGTADADHFKAISRLIR